MIYFLVSDSFLFHLRNLIPGKKLFFNPTCLPGNMYTKGVPMGTAPCAGCPPCCAECIFDPSGTQVTPTQEVSVVLSQEKYGCIHGGSLVRSGKQAGLLRGNVLHSLTVGGRDFLHKSGNPLALKLVA